MKHKIRDIIIVFIDAFGISALYRAYMRRKGPLVRVLCFHDVPDRAWFEGVVKMLVTDFHVITPEQFHGKDFDEEKINVLLTFDDGYHSWVDTCLPVMEEYGLKGIFFITSGLLDSAQEGTADTFMRERLLISPKRPLTWEGARSLREAGNEIGGHTRTHADLGKISLEDARIEMVADRERLTAKLGIKPLAFAYPFGRKWNVRPEIAPIAVQAGFHSTFLAESDFVPVNKETDIPRTLLEKDQSLLSIRQWICGGYDIFNFFQI
jgi:peptidoglycan/xylan/chitin deacetylase (PgdA/CDA1 family)